MESRSSKPITLQMIIGNICSHAQLIATETAAGVNGARGRLKLFPVPGMETCEILIKPPHDGGSGKQGKANTFGHVWDQTEVNGTWEGNRCGAISAFAKLCSSALTKWLADTVAQVIIAETDRRGIKLGLSKEVLAQWILVGLALEEVE